MKKLRYKDIKAYRKKLFEEQDHKCLITKKIIPDKYIVLDHQHALKSETPGINGAGQIRGVLDMRANSFEGIILKKYKRSGLMNVIPLPDLLINIAKFLKKKPKKILHPKIY